MPLARAKPSAAGTPDSGTPMTMSASAGAWGASSSPMRQRVSWTSRPYSLTVGPRDVGELEDAQPRLGGSNYSILMFVGSIQAHSAYLDGAGPFFDFTCNEFLQIIP